jgi:3',5'-cyclic AMP phosphodiesterase CpdA
MAATALTLAHVSDLHVGQDRGDDGARSVRRARQAIDYLNALPGEIDGILVTGDLADHGTPDEYRTVAEILATARFPVLTCPGNHDERVAYQQVLLGEPDDAGQPVNHVHRVGGVTIAMCDSTIPGEDGGLLDDTTLTWLDKVLSDAADEPALVCFHHPPVVLHIPYVDAIRQQRDERLADVVAAHDNVAAVLCGHAHTSAVSTFAGRPLVVAPGVVSTILLPFERARSAEPAVDYDVAPAIAFHVLGDRGLVTHFRSV